MFLCVGVAFKRVARSYWFDPNRLELRENDRVVVETTRGVELGTVKILPRQVPDDEIQAPLKKVLRLATQADLDQEKSNRSLAQNAMKVCQEYVSKLDLEMRLLQAEYTFDCSQVTIYFTAESRVDFRELVRELSTSLRCKIQLHQVGARDQARMIGGVGACGLTLCCSTFLSEFAPISIKMAKDQSLFLNPAKYSGVCGKLMCCLRFEHEGPEPERQPQIADVVMTPDGQGKVIDINARDRSAVVRMLESAEAYEEKVFDLESLRLEKTTRCTDCRGCSVNELIDNEDEATSPDEETRDRAARLAELRATTGQLEEV